VAPTKYRTIQKTICHAPSATYIVSLIIQMAALKH
jgi:hypothetical protein